MYFRPPLEAENAESFGQAQSRRRAANDAVQITADLSEATTRATLESTDASIPRCINQRAKVPVTALDPRLEREGSLQHVDEPR
jgi:hypothetical protein